MDVGVTQHGEVLVLLNGRLLHLEQTETFTQLSAQLQLFFCSVPISLLTSLHLVLVAVNTRRSKTVGPQVLPGLVLVGSAVVTPAQRSQNRREKKTSHSMRLLTARGGHGGSRGCGGRAVSWR